MTTSTPCPFENEHRQHIPRLLMSGRDDCEHEWETIGEFCQAGVKWMQAGRNLGCVHCGKMMQRTDYFLDGKFYPTPHEAQEANRVDAAESRRQFNAWQVKRAEAWRGNNP